MITNEGIVDGSWLLNVLVTDLQIERTLRVKGDLHIGGLMLKLVESLDVAADWSDHSFYWPDRTLWLTRSRTTLDQYSVQADAKLWFTSMHKNIQIQLPDLHRPTLRVNFSVNIFSVVIRLCKELGIRHPEELSLMRKIDPNELKQNQGASGTKSTHRLPTGLHQPASISSSNLALNEVRTPGTSGFLTPDGTLSRGFNPLSGRHSPNYSFNANGMQTPGSMHSLDFDGSMSSQQPSSPAQPSPNLLPKPKSISEIARLNSVWLDSSRSLMEQGVKETDVILLRYKFFTFYDLNTKYDAARIHYIFEQAKWSIQSEEVSCSEDEMILFAALQVQAEKKANLSHSDLSHNDELSEDEIDSALSNLQVSLEGHTQSDHSRGLTTTPKLKDCMRCYRPKKFHVKTFKKYWFVLKNSTLYIHRSETCDESDLLQEFELNGEKGFTVTSSCDANNKFFIKLLMPHDKSLMDLWLEQDDEEQYVKWLGALRVVQQGKTMADVKSYENEMKSIRMVVSLHKKPAPGSPAVIDINQLNPDQLFSPKFLNRSKSKQLLQKVIEANTNMKNMSKLEAQMNYIKSWQMLPKFGYKYFIIKIENSKKIELLGVGTDRLIKLDIKKEEITRTWMYKTIKSWSINWEIKQVQLSFEHDEDLAFKCLTAGCKVVHEFIGGYIFLSMRSGDKNQALDEELFHKLTGGWVQ